MTEVPTITLNDGNKMPLLGLGVFQIPDHEKARQTVEMALANGYRMIDTAEVYENQIKDKINWEEVNEIIFPQQIDRIAVSFIQGFAKEILKKVDKNDVEKLFVFKASNKELEDKILNNIIF